MSGFVPSVKDIDTKVLRKKEKHEKYLKNTL